MPLRSRLAAVAALLTLSAASGCHRPSLAKAGPVAGLWRPQHGLVAPAWIVYADGHQRAASKEGAVDQPAAPGCLPALAEAEDRFPRTELLLGSRSQGDGPFPTLVIRRAGHALHGIVVRGLESPADCRTDDCRAWAKAYGICAQQLGARQPVTDGQEMSALFEQQGADGGQVQDACEVSPGATVQRTQSWLQVRGPAALLEPLAPCVRLRYQGAIFRARGQHPAFPDETLLLP